MPSPFPSPLGRGIHRVQTGHILYILQEVANEEFSYSFHVPGILRTGLLMQLTSKKCKPCAPSKM